jgi:CBS domain containing-hemolysin-like protein
MQRSGAHLAQIATTKGRVVGIVALEDVLEELVGAIRDDTQKLQR